MKNSTFAPSTSATTMTLDFFQENELPTLRSAVLDLFETVSDYEQTDVTRANISKFDKTYFEETAKLVSNSKIASEVKSVLTDIASAYSSAVTSQVEVLLTSVNIFRKDV